jgi:hypothetical protein
MSSLNDSSNFVVESDLETQQQTTMENLENNLVVENDHETKTTPRYVLQLSCGLTVEFVLHETAALCIWSHPPTLRLMDSILREYPQWRDSVLNEWKERGRISWLNSTSKLKVLIARETG